MKQFRLSTAVLLVIIAALFLGLMVQQRDMNRRHAELAAIRVEIRRNEKNNRVWIQMEKDRLKALADQLEISRKAGR